MRLFVVSLLLLTFASSSSAQERWLLSLEPSAAMTLGNPQGDWFGPGIAGALTLTRTLHAKVSIHARIRGAFFFDGPAPEEETGFADPGHGTLSTLGLGLRLRPFGPTDSRERATGFWIEGGGGVGLTGDLYRAVLDAGFGFNFAVGGVDLGPAIRYVHVIQPSGQLESSDGHVIMLGIDVTLFDGRDVPEDPEPESVRDSDGDGYDDPDDGCPFEPEDFDEFEDEDGCPDPDNDADGILDVEDECPMVPEDPDGFEDEDGCPDPDNDQDGFLDPDDECPNEPEIVNGVEDDDGCPDEGLIEMVDDRIVLDENVLFDFERARVKRAARPIVDAIVHLIELHPEWTRMAVEGHADVRGNEEYNQSLSFRRARNVVRELTRRGVDPNRVSFEGFGSSRPRTSGRSEDAHQQNRRVEFVVAERASETEAEADADADADADAEADADADAESVADAEAEAEAEADADADAVAVADAEADADAEAEAEAEADAEAESVADADERDDDDEAEPDERAQARARGEAQPTRSKR